MTHKIARPFAAAALSALLASCSFTGVDSVRDIVAPMQIVDDADIASDIRGSFGGVYAAPALERRLADIGAIMADELLAPTPRISLLDDPVRMAFRAPGDRYFLTRGMVAMLSSDSEAAALLGFMMAGQSDRAVSASFVTPDSRNIDDLRRMFPSDTAIGARVRKIVRPHLFAIDLQPDRYVDDIADSMLDRGWNPDGIVSLGAKLANARDIMAVEAGGVAAPLDFPSTFSLDLTAAALEIADEREGRDEPAPPQPDNLLELMDGFAMGPEPDGARLSRGVITHSGLGFEIQPPAGSTFISEARALRIFTPKGARIVIEGIDGVPPTDHMASYLRDRPGRALDFINVLRNVVEMRIGRYSVGIGEARVSAGGGAAMLVAAIRERRDSRMYEVMAVWPGEIDAAGAEATSALATMTPTGADVRGGRLDIVTAGDGASSSSFAPGLSFADSPEMLFSALNGLPPGASPTPGMQVKVVRP